MISVNKKTTTVIVTALALFAVSSAVVILFPRHAHYLVLAMGGVLAARGFIPLRRYRALEGWAQCTACFL